MALKSSEVRSSASSKLPVWSYALRLHCAERRFKAHKPRTTERETTAATTCASSGLLMLHTALLQCCGAAQPGTEKLHALWKERSNALLRIAEDGVDALKLLELLGGALCRVAVRMQTQRKLAICLLDFILQPACLLALVGDALCARASISWHAAQASEQIQVRVLTPVATVETKFMSDADNMLSLWRRTCVAASWTPSTCTAHANPERSRERIQASARSTLRIRTSYSDMFLVMLASQRRWEAQLGGRARKRSNLWQDRRSAGRLKRAFTRFRGPLIGLTQSLVMPVQARALWRAY